MELRPVLNVWGMLPSQRETYIRHAFHEWNTPHALLEPVRQSSARQVRGGGGEDLGVDKYTNMYVVRARAPWRNDLYGCALSICQPT